MAKQAIIQSLMVKVDRVIEENIRLQNECKLLSQQNTKLERENRKLKESESELQRRLGKMELRSGFLADEGDKKRVKRRINQLMREIDKCIALMDKE